MAWQGVVLLVSLALRVLNRSGVGSHDHTRNWGWESGDGGEGAGEPVCNLHFNNQNDETSVLGAKIC